jgi:hypothetical protein
MKHKLAISDIDFADSELKSFEMTEENNLVVYINSWDERVIKIIFSNMIQFSYKLESQVSQIYEVLDITPFFDEALSKNYETVPIDHPFKHYQIWDIDDFPIIEVVAESTIIDWG